MITAREIKRILLSTILAGAGIIGISNGLEYLTNEPKPQVDAFQQNTREYSPRQIPTTGNMQGNLENKIQKNDLVSREEDIHYRYREFGFPDELFDIMKHSKRVGVEPEMLMAIRMAENGNDSLAYGIIPQGDLKKRYSNDKGYLIDGKFFAYLGEKEKQLCWSAQTVKKNLQRFSENPEGHEDFISYLANRYAPIGASNDPEGLNNHWESNVRQFYEEFAGEE